MLSEGPSTLPGTADRSTAASEEESVPHFVEAGSYYRFAAAGDGSDSIAVAAPTIAAGRHRSEAPSARNGCLTCRHRQTCPSNCTTCSSPSSPLWAPDPASRSVAMAIEASGSGVYCRSLHTLEKRRKSVVCSEKKRISRSPCCLHR